MLAAMTTVSSGLMSPNSYGLSPDQVAAKMAADHVESEYDHFRRDSAAFVRLHEHHQQRSRTSTNSSDDSESEAYPASPKTTEANSVAQLPKRNKRKNFKPRCSSSSNLPANEEEAATSDYVNVNNNNSLKNVRRRKTLATPRKVLVDRSSPMDLSRGGEESGSEVGGGGGGGGGGVESDSDSEDGVGRENGDGGKIPSSFSIHNLSQPYVPDFGGAALTQGQMSEMREYAMNTMRELLGIYGLTSEVAESISKQLPIAAFNTGKILENLSLASSHNNNPFQHRTPPSPPSQPPTPPSTPLSPKSDFAAKYAAAAATSSPFVTITRSSSPHHPHHTLLQQQKQPSTGGGNPSAAASSSPVPLNLKQHQKSPRVAFSNGDFGLFGHHQQEKEERSPGCSGGGQSTRGIFPVQFPGMKMEESNSPPVVDSNPLNAMMAQSLAPTPSRDPSGAAAANLLLNKTQNQLDYSKYVKKFASSLECGSNYCKDLNYREHFHCLDCNSRVFIKKEEMIRHFKWHKKRDESLQHGFMRYSPLDDCGDRYANCTHNKKQTHYHCIKEGCDKVYISTSDVQMHANYHRKDSAIIQEGFQRYRATEECGASYCAFFGQRTTHFHCRRANCRFTFKNKSDMEKHKSYHIKDEQLSRDGFKKFMKNESCPYENCRFSKVCNHIHCIRPQCNYVLHSSGQLFSHKRKHERKDSELAYRKYKLAQSMMKTLQESGAVGYDAQQHFEGMASLAAASSNVSESLSERNSPVDYEDADGGGSSSAAMDLTGGGVQEETISWNGEEFWRKYCRFVGREESCEGRCEYGFVDHYHCLVERCEMVFNCRDAVREHARNHEQQEQVTDGFYSTSCCDDGCMYQDREKHWHCNWENCREVILLTDKPFRRLEHYKMHEYSRKLSLTKDPLTMTHLATSIDGMFCRKRGRPPKNRVIEVWNDYAPLGGQSLMDSPQAIFTSFKLPKPSTAQSSSKDMEQQDSNDERSHSPTPNDTLHGFDFYPDSTKCPDSLCPYLGTVHYHCSRDRCLYVTDKDDSLLAHSRDFHDNIDIPDGFEFCDRTVDCRLPGCPSNRVNRHFHCTRCGYSFVQYSTMAVHNQKHVAGEEALVKTEDGEESAGGGGGLCGAVNLSQQESKVSVVKASGTFYPLSSLPERNISPDLSKSTETSEQTSANTLYGPELSCSRPFCKLKRKYHYHCNACNQAFSELDRLLTHAAKHTNLNNNNNTSNIDDEQQQQQQTTEAVPKINVAPLQSLQNPTKIDQMDATAAAAAAAAAYLPPNFDAYSHFSNFQLALMSQQNAFLPQSLYQNAGLMFQHPGLMQAAPSPFTTENLTSPLAAMAANLNKRSLSPHNTHEMSPEQKKVRIQNSMRMLKDEPVPEGYLRFRFNEDCQYQHCGYREHQTHFHCQRQDCGYSFCDKTRFVQHTARHERLDTLMGGDFQQYRANVACGRPDCAYTTNLGATQNKASHFHCLKCEFVCTDTNKVVAHRRQHQKLDSIQAAGFEKFTPSQHCRAPSCQHSGKQTHYHCLSCQYAVLGLAQMSAHKYRHMEG